MNIQVVGEKDAQTKVYINGELKKTFASGSGSYTYNYATVGDLRVGRNCKFIGKVYTVDVYGKLLSEDEITQNWENAQRYIH